MSDSKEEAHRRGYRVGYLGDDVFEFNPYRKDTEEYRQWDLGKYEGAQARARSGMHSVGGGGDWGGFTRYN